MLQGEAKLVSTHKELRGALPIGSHLFGYELVAVLGQGTFGITYHARDSKLARDVAIKEYLPTALALREGCTTVVPRSTELAGDFTWGRERFLEEAKTLAKLDGAPAVVKVIDFLEANGTAYMVMALVRGNTLEWRIRKNGTLVPSEIERLLEPLLDGLQCVHEAGFLHRDIKPANIILDGNGKPTLIDFGPARAAMAGHTATMTAVFTPGYAAAEQFASGKQGAWTDIYGLSATLHHAITGETLPNAIDRTLDDAYRPLIKRAPPGHPVGLLAGVDAGLAVRRHRPAPEHCQLAANFGTDNMSQSRRWHGCGSCSLRCLRFPPPRRVHRLLRNSDRSPLSVWGCGRSSGGGAAGRRRSLCGKGKLKGIAAADRRQDC